MQQILQNKQYFSNSFQVFIITQFDIHTLFLGEEQGLYGSDANAANLVREGHKPKLKYVITMDMISYKVFNNFLIINFQETIK